MPDDDDFADRLADVDPPWHISLVMGAEDDDWQLTSNCENQETVVAALLGDVFKFATGQMTFGDDPED